MFRKDYTSSIISFINSLLRLGKNEEYQELMNEAIQELKSRVPLMAKCYEINNQEAY